MNDVIARSHDYLRDDSDPLLDFDLASLRDHWLELKRIVKDLGRSAQLLRGFQTQVQLYYTTAGNSPISSPIKERLPVGEKRVIALDRGGDAGRSLLKEKGRRWFAKLSIPYRVFIKSKVKLRYRRGGGSRDTSYADSDLSTITDCGTASCNSSFSASSPPDLDESRLSEIVREVRERLAYEDSEIGDSSSAVGY